MADTNIKIIIDAIDNASNVLKGVGENIEKSLGKGAQTNVTGMGAAMDGALGTVARFAVAGAAVATGVGVVVGAYRTFTNTVSGMLEQSAEQQRVMAQTNAVLRSTGDISGVSAQRVRQIAEQIERK